LGSGGANVPGFTGATELYDGNVWTSAPPLATARGFMAGSGSQAAALTFGGASAPPARSANTEEFTGPQTTATASTLTTS
jgi:hypothetical protein